jgi:hypothetical protein
MVVRNLHIDGKRHERLDRFIATILRGFRKRCLILPRVCAFTSEPTCTRYRMFDTWRRIVAINTGIWPFFFASLGSAAIETSRRTAES